MKLFLSSAEISDKFYGFKQLEQLGNKYYLYSYLNVRSSKQLLDYLSVKGEVFLDSGAHTFQKPGKQTDWEKFVHDYIEFIVKYNQYLKYVVELDIENKVGLPQVERWTQDIIAKTGRQPIVVWHRDRGYDYLQYMTKKYPYIGFSGFVEDKTGEPEVPNRFVNTFCKLAHDNNCKVHGFGYTRSDVRHKHFDSIDSSSWRMGIRFGSMDKFMGNRMVRIKSVKNFSNRYEKIADWNTKEWIAYQTYLDTITWQK